MYSIVIFAVKFGGWNVVWPLFFSHFFKDISQPAKHEGPVSQLTKHYVTYSRQ